MLDILKSILLGIVEGITEWLPVSSTGHLILADEFIKLGMSKDFKEMFDVVVQLGAILAVVVIFWHRLWPFTLNKTKGYNYITKGPGLIKKQTMDMWLKVLVAILPAMAIGIPFDDKINKIFFKPTVVAGALILYGILFIVIEWYNKDRKPKIKTVNGITYKTALFIGLFQVLSLIPGTSRSGSTILGAILIGVSRVAAAEFSFYMAVPVMFGASFLKLLKFGFSFTGPQIAVLIAGMLSAFLVSIAAIRFLMSYVKKHNFALFGYYRIALGIIVLVYFALAK